MKAGFTKQEQKIIEEKLKAINLLINEVVEYGFHFVNSIVVLP